MTKPANDNKKSSGWTKPDPEQAAQDEVEKLKDEAGAGTLNEEPRTVDDKELKAYKLGLWYGKRLGQLYSLQRTVPHIEKQNARLAKAGRKVAHLKNALRAQIEANALSADALDD